MIIQRATRFKSLVLFLAVFCTGLTAFAKADHSNEKVWETKHLRSTTLNFRFDSGDVIIVTRPTGLPSFGSKLSNVTLTRRNSKTPSDPTRLERFGNPLQIVVPDTMAGANGMSEELRKFLKPIAFETQRTGINLIYIQNGNGVLIVGQIGSTQPHRYFTHFEPAMNFGDLPNAQLVWNLDKTAQEGDLRIGLKLGLKNGKAITRVLTVPDSTNERVVVAKARQASPEDQQLLALQAVDGHFSVPRALEEIATASLVSDSSGEVTGVELLRQARRKVEGLKSQLKETIFGQDQAIDTMAAQYGETLRNGMKKPKVMIAMGPSGVGKTYIAQQFSSAITASSANVLEINGNEFGADEGSRDSARIFGTASSVSNAQPGMLVEWLLANKGSGTLIINEGDKMHRSIWIKFMELFESGKLTDGKGHPVPVNELYVVITTNRGAKRMFPSTVANWSQEDIDKRLKGLTKAELKGFYTSKDGLNDNNVLPEEILNRVDAFIPFGPLSREAAVKIAERRTRELVAEYKRKFKVVMTVSSDAVKRIALLGFSAANDARQIRQQVQNLFSEAIEMAEAQLDIGNGDEVRIENNDSDARHPRYSISARNKTVSLNAPVVPTTNVFDQPEQIETLTTLEATLKKQVIGQDTTIHQVAEAVKSHRVTSDGSRPLILGLLGPSGNGKTETGRALANALYGSAARLSIIPMGNISSEGQFDNIFGISAQYQGGDVERVFEKALRENPDGGVLVFDEFTNMGGKDPGLRASLMMKLYDIFEEGRYVSPVDGKVFSLGKYVLILNGNEGEQFFTGITSDDMLLAQWRDNKDEAKVRQMLTNAHIPPALINRAALWSLTKPLLSYEIDQVTRKLWAGGLKEFLSKNPGVKVTVEDSFYAKLAKAFFSPDQGGRSMRRVLDTRIGALLFDIMTSLGSIEANKQGSEIQVGLRDNALKKPYRSRISPARDVSFTATLVRNGRQEGTIARSVTESASAQVLLNGKEALLTAVHEAGHAVANDPSVTGQRVAFITIRGGQAKDVKYYGYARYESLDGTQINPDRARTIMEIAKSWAGRKAQELAGYPPDAGWSQDVKQIRQIATQYLTTWALDDDLIGIPLDREGNPQVMGPKAALLEQRIQQLQKEGEHMAERLLRERWSLVRAVAAELTMKGQISGDRFAALETAYGTRRATPRQMPAARMQPQICRDVFL